MNATILIAFIIIAIAGVFVIVMIISGRKTTRRKQQVLQELLDKAVQDNGLQITKRESFRSRIMALDTANNKLLLVSGLQQTPELQLLDLDQLTVCEVVKTYHGGRMPGGKRQVTHVNKVELEFRFKHTEPVLWVVYSEMYDHALDLRESSSRAHRWRELIFQ